GRDCEVVTPSLRNIVTTLFQISAHQVRGSVSSVLWCKREHRMIDAPSRRTRSGISLPCRDHRVSVQIEHARPSERILRAHLSNEIDIPSVTEARDRNTSKNRGIES